MGVVDLMSQCFSLFELLVRIAELPAILKIGTSAHDRDPVYEPWSRSAVHPQSPLELLTCELIRVGRKLSGFVRPALPLIFKSARSVKRCRDGGVSVQGGFLLITFR